MGKKPVFFHCIILASILLCLILLNETYIQKKLGTSLETPRALVREDPTCCRATKLTRRNY